ncbi:entericidin A/B family lipoprotein [Pusillimonas sp. SM2304]|nr:entericidin A/B family lipoprotein [Pusillimonas sp. SM2304]MDS1141816.1 entericidin A/B family lipoprotein [Pusillimonas sp. SM2304]
MKNKILAMFALLGCLAMAGCANTVDGAGQDISKAGDAISRSVK